MSDYIVENADGFLDHSEQSQVLRDMPWLSESGAMGKRYAMTVFMLYTVYLTL